MAIRYAVASGNWSDAANVWSDTDGGAPGTYHEATVAEVKKDTAFGPASGYTGTYEDKHRFPTPSLPPP